MGFRLGFPTESSNREKQAWIEVRPYDKSEIRITAPDNQIIKGSINDCLAFDAERNHNRARDLCSQQEAKRWESLEYIVHPVTNDHGALREGKLWYFGNSSALCLLLAFSQQKIPSNNDPLVLFSADWEKTKSGLNIVPIVSSNHSTSLVPKWEQAKAAKAAVLMLHQDDVKILVDSSNSIPYYGLKDWPPQKTKQETCLIGLAPDDYGLLCKTLGIPDYFSNPAFLQDAHLVFANKDIIKISHFGKKLFSFFKKSSIPLLFLLIFFFLTPTIFRLKDYAEEFTDNNKFKIVITSFNSPNSFDYFWTHYSWGIGEEIKIKQCLQSYLSSLPQPPEIIVISKHIPLDAFDEIKAQSEELSGNFIVAGEKTNNELKMRLLVNFTPEELSAIKRWQQKYQGIFSEAELLLKNELTSALIDNCTELQQRVFSGYNFLLASTNFITVNCNAIFHAGKNIDERFRHLKLFALIQQLLCQTVIEGKPETNNISQIEEQIGYFMGYPHIQSLLYTYLSVAYFEENKERSDKYLQKAVFPHQITIDLALLRIFKLLQKGQTSEANRYVEKIFLSSNSDYIENILGYLLLCTSLTMDGNYQKCHSLWQEKIQPFFNLSDKGLKVYFPNKDFIAYSLASAIDTILGVILEKYLISEYSDISFIYHIIIGTNQFRAFIRQNIQHLNYQGLFKTDLLFASVAIILDYSINKSHFGSWQNLYIKARENITAFFNELNNNNPSPIMEINFHLFQIIQNIFFLDKRLSVSPADRGTPIDEIKKDLSDNLFLFQQAYRKQEELHFPSLLSALSFLFKLQKERQVLSEKTLEYLGSELFRLSNTTQTGEYDLLLMTITDALGNYAAASQFAQRTITKSPKTCKNYKLQIELAELYKKQLKLDLALQEYNEIAEKFCEKENQKTKDSVLLKASWLKYILGQSDFEILSRLWKYNKDYELDFDNYWFRFLYFFSQGNIFNPYLDILLKYQPDNQQVFCYKTLISELKEGGFNNLSEQWLKDWLANKENRQLLENHCWQLRDRFFLAILDKFPVFKKNVNTFWEREKKIKMISSKISYYLRKMFSNLFRIIGMSCCQEDEHDRTLR